MQPDYSQVVISNTLDKSAWQLGNIVRTEMEKITRDYSFGKREYPAIKHTCLLIYFTRHLNLYSNKGSNSIRSSISSSRILLLERDIADISNLIRFTRTFPNRSEISQQPFAINSNHASGLCEL